MLSSASTRDRVDCRYQVILRPRFPVPAVAVCRAARPSFWSSRACNRPLNNLPVLRTPYFSPALFVQVVQYASFFPSARRYPLSNPSNLCPLPGGVQYLAWLSQTEDRLCLASCCSVLTSSARNIKHPHLTKTGARQCLTFGTFNR